MIHIENLRVEAGSFALGELDLTIDDHEYFMILGPTGAGKTVLLESIAGLNPVKSGHIWLNGKNITNLKPEKREVSLVYQDHALFPHLSVRENILFGLKMRRKPGKEMCDVLNWLADLLDIANLLDRRPETLSGGERQKVSLARALSTRPQILLLDEPLSALDPETREEVREELYNLHRTLNNTIVHVTHDFQEAMALGDRVAVIAEGRFKQVGTPEQIFRTPESVFVARFALVRNIFRGHAEKSNYDEAIFLTDGMRLKILSDVRGPCFAAIRPEDIRLSLKALDSDTSNSFLGTVAAVVDKGDSIQVTMNIPPIVKSLISRRQYTELGLRVGDRAHVTIDPVSVHLIKE